jgi:hypothetical protein
MKLCILVSSCHFRGSINLHCEDKMFTHTKFMEAAGFHKMLVTTCQIIWGQNPET